MKTTRVIAAVLVASLAWSTALAAQDGASKQAAPAAAAPASVEALLAALADIELRVTVDRDFGGADKALAELLASVEAQGQSAWLQDARVAAAVTRIRDNIATASKVDRSELEEAVLRVVATGDSAALGAMGSSGLELLAGLVRAGRERQVDVGTGERPSVRRVTPDGMLWMAFNVDPHRATDMLLDSRDALRRSGMRLSDLLHTWLRPMSWNIAPGQRATPPDTRLLDVLVEELQRVQTTDDMPTSIGGTPGNLLSTLAMFDAFTPALRDELLRITRASPWGDARYRIALNLAGMGSDGDSARWWVRSAQPYFEALLDDERVEARRFAAETLAWAQGSERLLRSAGDTDAIVRRHVAASLRPHPLRYWAFERRDVIPNQPAELMYQAQPDPHGLQILQDLARDPDAGVREEVAHSLVAQRGEVDETVLRALAHDTDAGVRAVLAGASSSSPNLLAELLLDLAHDAEPLVLKQVDMRFNDLDWNRNGALFLPVLRARVENREQPFSRFTNTGLEFLLGNVAQRPEGRAALTHWSIETGDTRPLAAVVTEVVPPGRDSFEPDDLNIWLALEPQDLARLLPLLEPLSPFLTQGLVGELKSSRRCEAIAAAVDPLVGDASLATTLRLQLAAFVESTHATPERLAAITALLDSDAVKSWEPTQSWERDRIADVVRAIPPVERNRTIRELVAEERALPEGLRVLTLKDGMNADTAAGILVGYAPDAEGGEALTRFILTSWLDTPTDRFGGVVIKAIGALGPFTDAESAAWLRAGLHQRIYCLPALKAAGERREPEFLADIGACIGASWLPDDQWPKMDLSVRAISILTGKCTLEAGEVLLENAAGPDPTLRDLCINGVTKIRAYLDSVDDWQKRKAGSATRDAAIGQLVELLHDADPAVRAESVRGLGTLHAVEQLPAVIEALHDPEASVRKAAVQALDRLNAEVATAEPAPAGG